MQSHTASTHKQSTLLSKAQIQVQHNK